MQSGQGPLEADCALLRVGVASGQLRPGPEVWLWLRMHLHTLALKTYLCPAMADIPEPARVALAGRALAPRDFLPSGQTMVGFGRLRRSQRAGLASHHEPSVC